MLFCAFVGTAWAEVNAELVSKTITVGDDATAVVENQWYVLYNHNRKACVSEETTVFKMRPLPANDAVAELNAGKLFKFIAVEGEDNQYYIVSGNGLYFDFVNNNTSSVSETPVAYKVVQIGQNEGHFYIQHATNGFIADGQDSGDGFVCWNKNVPESVGGNNCYHFKPVTLTEVGLFDVTYNYYVGEDLKHTEVVKYQEEGNPVAAPTFGYVSFTAPTGTVSASNKVFDIQCELEETPISFSSDVNNIDWQIVEMHRGFGDRFWFYHEASKEVKVYNWANACDALNDCYLWGFVGDQFGFKIYNKAAGTTVTLNATSGSPKVGTASNGNDNWILAKSSYESYKDIVNTTVCFTNDRTNYMNQQGGVAKYWTSNDNGSTCFIHSYSDKLKLAAQALATDLTDVASVPAGYVGTYTATPQQIEALNECLNSEPLDVASAKDVISNVLATKVAFAPGYYRLVCVAPKTGNGGDSSYNTLTFNGNNNLVTAPMDEKSVNQVFRFVDAGEGKYYLQSPNAQKHLTNISAGSYRAPLTDSAAEGKLSVESLGSAQHQIKGSYGLYAENHPTESIPYACAGWTAGLNSPSAWYIIPATELDVTVTEAGFATLNLPFDVTLPNTVKAYAVEGVEGDWLTMEVKADIPANKGAILEGEGTHTLAIAAATTDWSKNLLLGTNVNTEITDEAYVLGNGSDGVGLYKALMTEGKWLNNANKAYLPASAVTVAGVKALRFNFGGTTAIESVVTGLDTNAAIYDLSGRRVEKAVKGIYIQNGKKIIVK